jgi:hypothetical protein
MSMPHERDTARVSTLYQRAGELLNVVSNPAELVKVCRLVLLVRRTHHPFNIDMFQCLFNVFFVVSPSCFLFTFPFSFTGADICLMGLQLPYESSCQSIFSRACAKLFDFSRKPSNDVYFHQESLFDPLLMVLQHAHVYSFEEVSFGMSSNHSLSFLNLEYSASLFTPLFDSPFHVRVHRLVFIDLRSDPVVC